MPIAETKAGLAVETISDLTRAAALREAWLSLEQHQNRAVFFQSFAWCMHVWRTRHSLALPQAPEPRVIVVKRDARVVAIWPLAIVSGTAGRYAQELTEPFGQYADMLVEPGEDAGEICDRAAREIAGWRVDGLVLRKVRADSALQPWLERNGTLAGGMDAAPEVALTAAGGYEAYRGSLNAKTRKNLRNYRNRLSREGRLVHTLHDDRAEIAGVVERCFEGRTGWLETSGLSSTAFSDPAFSRVIAELSRQSGDLPKTVALRLALAEETGEGSETELSLHWGFEHAGRYYAYMASRNSAFDAFSPGRLHLEDVIEALADRGIDTVDLLMPAIPYKTSVATATIPVATYGVSFTLRGKLAIDGWHGYLRPALKKAMLALPPAARRGIMSVKAMFGSHAAAGNAGLGAARPASGA